MNNRVLIIGDVMIDTYVYGGVSRVSPEAPVPVMCPEHEINCLGGAANVARNVSSLGAEADVIFLIGDDEKGEILKHELINYGISTKYVVSDKSKHTINKVRIVGNNQQIVRIDYHDKLDLTPSIFDQVKKSFNESIETVDIVVISDYGKGMCTEDVCKYVINKCIESNKPIIIDPKGSDWSKYKGATIITPNLKEINAFSGLKVKNNNFEIELNYTDINETIGVDYVLLTRSECGMSLIGKRSVTHIPAETHEVYDVSGAGDTVVATVASLLHTNLDNIKETVYISNLAAGIVVAKPGTAVVYQDEIKKRLSGNSIIQNGKIYTIDQYVQLKEQLRLWKTAGETIVTTNGCFDILHSGHIKLLSEAKKYGSKLIVLINSDLSIKRLKGEERPINSEYDRAYILSALKYVDAVVIFDPRQTPYNLNNSERVLLNEKAFATAMEAPMFALSIIKPHVHVKGGDYCVEDLPEAIFAKEIQIVKYQSGYSTTKTIKKMAK